MVNPYQLLLITDQTPTWIDLDEYEWMKTYADLMRKPGQWHLVHRETQVVALSIWVHPGEQPYYTMRGFGSNKTASQMRAYGIGKKRTDGHVDRLWILENGQVCAGDDVNEFAPEALKER